MKVTEVNKNNFQTEVLESDKPVLLDFWASWCGPCRAVAPVIDEIAQENPEIKVCKVNIDEEKDLANEYGVMSIPTFLVIKDGKVVNQAVGVKPKKQITQMLSI